MLTRLSYPISITVKINPEIFLKFCCISKSHILFVCLFVFPGGLTTFIQHHSHYSLHHALFSLDSVVALSSYFKKSEATSTKVPQIPLYNYIFILISILLYILLSLEGLEI